MKKLQFWWHYLTNSSFRNYTHLHDIQKFQDDIKRQMEEMARCQSNVLYKQMYPPITNKDNLK